MILIDPPAVPRWGRSGPTWPATRRTTSCTRSPLAQGVPERGFDRDHYDVPAEYYDAMVAAGADR